MAHVGKIPLGATDAYTAIPSATNFVIDASTERLGIIFQAEEDDMITHVFTRYGARTGTPPTYRKSLQAIDPANGDPTNTVLGGGTPASMTFTPPADTTWNGLGRWYQLDNALNVTRGELYAIVTDHSSGTIDGSNNSSFTRSLSFGTTITQLPYADEFTGTWTKRNAMPPYGYKSATKVYGRPVSNSQAVNVHTGTTPDEVGIKFTWDANWATAQVIGLFGLLRLLTAGLTFDMLLYNSSDTVLQSKSFDTDNFGVATNVGFAELIFDESTLSSLSTGSMYRITLLPTTGTNTLTWYSYEFLSLADMRPFPFGGDMVVCQRTNAGAWTDFDNPTDGFRYPALVPLVTDITAPAASGGVIGGPNKRGGKQ